MNDREMNLTSDLYLELIRGGAAALSRKRQIINELNVFPIPDGDTGDNMYMTIEAGTHAEGASLGEMAASVSRGMLLGARGNSGVILSRIFAGIAKGLEGRQEAGIEEFCAAMRCGVDEAYHAVSNPVEGTILTVLREGVAAADGSKEMEEYFERSSAAMDISVQHTPELLDVLKEAGVVDSGGAGLLCIIEGMLGVLRGESIDAEEVAPTAQKVDFNAFTEDSVLEFGYCTEFLLRLQRSKLDLDSFDESVIKDWLSGIGDSLVFFRDGSIIKVHVHTMDPGKVLSKCREWGEFLTIKVENMTLQHHENHMDQRFGPQRKAVGIVTVAAGDKLRKTFLEMGADQVVPGGQTMNPPVERFLEAFAATRADTLLVFPNNPNILLTARQAAELYKDAKVLVIPTRNVGEGYYALASLDLTEAPEAVAAQLEEAVSATRSGMVSRAVRESDAGAVGDYLGFSGKDILCGSASRKETILALARELDARSADVIILMSGAEVPEDEAEAVRARLEETCPLSEVIPIDGGQPIYDYILLLC